MRRLLSPIALVAITVSAVPLTPRAAAPVISTPPLPTRTLAAIHTGRPTFSPTHDAAPTGDIVAVRSVAGEQIDVWMNEQGVGMILDAARPVAAPAVAARR